MSENLQSQVDRREFLQTGALAAASTAVLGHAATGRGQDAPAADAKTVLPTRKLGKTGVDVTMLNIGTGAWRTTGAAGSDRLLRLAYANGIRYIDTANAYRTEPFVAKYFKDNPAARKDTFLVTKDTPKPPSDMIGMLDKRLETLQLDSVDLFFFHGLGDDHTTDQAMEFFTGKEFKETAEKIRKSGKAKFVGFSCHHANKAMYIEAAAKAGFVDAIMVAYTPWATKEHPINKALDLAHEKGIGLISMKQLAGVQAPGMGVPQYKSRDEMLADVPNHVPSLKGKGFSNYQMLLQAIWSDERIASCCVSMTKTEQITENVAAARKFEPLKEAQLREIHEMFLASAPTLCANCDGSCSRAAGTTAPLGDLARFLTYHQHHGMRAEARRLYQGLSDAARDWQGADLAAAQAACPSHLNFSEILPAADRYLA